MSKKEQSTSEKWAFFRFSVVGRLLAKPPEKGELQKELKLLSLQTWRHPINGEETKFHYSTIERWYYKTLNADDPIVALYRKIRSDAGDSKAMSAQLLAVLHKQYISYQHWSFKLHFDNLTVFAEEYPELGEPPSYSTVVRRMQERGWTKKRSRRRKQTPGEQKAAERLEKREVRSYESTHVHGLWHLDFHMGSRRIVDAGGEWYTPKALCIMDDRSRLCCHIQWYLDETAETLFHGLVQAFHKRGLPRALMTDNGSAMLAHETVNGLERLGICHEKTLPHSPYQNGKQEAFWGQLEGRLLAMLSNVDPLTLDMLNVSTQAWVEMEYNQTVHEELGVSPVQRMLQGPSLERTAPGSEALRFSFTLRESRVQRRSDGTIQICGVRFEIPSRFRHMKRLYVRYAGWNLQIAWLVDERTGDLLAGIYPQDKTKNASAERRTLEPACETGSLRDIESDPIPPLLRKLIADYASTGMPPAYIPREENEVQVKTDHSVEES